MSPAILRVGPYRFFYYAGEEYVEPPHVHVWRDDKIAKFWLDPVQPEIGGRFSRSELRRIERIVNEHRQALLEAWYGNFDDSVRS